ncbi:MAG: hypothetical protein HBSIN02_11250 [Bacteroidia bacterium]|nr:MAG: hypothetical protein HBSIN02_11250 [Bacteroidia bacterium]
MPRLCAILLWFLTIPAVHAQQSAIHQRLLLHVAELNALSVSPTVPAVEMQSAREAISRLVWTSNGNEKKITVAQRPPHTAGIRITLRDMDHRIAATQSVELTGPATIDLLYGLERSAGSCVVEFTVISPQVADSPPVQIIYTVTNS